MKKIISFSLYGIKPNFQVGAVVNVLEAKRLYPDWKCRFYTTDDDAICKQLEYLGAEIVRMDDWPDGEMFWRFLAVDDADVCISRDCDSVVNEREVGAVKEWLEQDYQWHGMHDHRLHKKFSMMDLKELTDEDLLSKVFVPSVCPADRKLNDELVKKTKV